MYTNKCATVYIFIEIINYLPATISFWKWMRKKMIHHEQKITLFYTRALSKRVHFQQNSKVQETASSSHIYVNTCAHLAHICLRVQNTFFLYYSNCWTEIDHDERSSVSIKKEWARDTCVNARVRPPPFYAYIYCAQKICSSCARAREHVTIN